MICINTFAYTGITEKHKPEVIMSNQQPPKVQLTSFWAGHLLLCKGSALNSGLLPHWDSLGENFFFFFVCRWLLIGDSVRLNDGYMCLLSALGLNLVWTHAGPVPEATVSVSSYIRICVVHVCLEGLDFLVFSTSLALNLFPPLFPQVPWAWRGRIWWMGRCSSVFHSAYCLAVFFYICSLLLQGKFLWWWLWKPLPHPWSGW